MTAEVSLARAVTLVASVGFSLVGLWEIAAPFGAGHFAASSGVAVCGENMLRFHTLLPVPEHLIAPPSAADCYCNHPFGIFWTAAAFAALFGHHDFVCRLPPLLMSTLTPPLLYALGSALWGPLAGALAALGFVVTPIALGFATFNALEVPVVFYTLLAGLGTVRLRQTGQRRWLLLTVVALAQAVNSDWPAFVFAAGLVGLVFLSAFLPGRAAGPVPPRYRALPLWGALIVGGVALAYLTAFAHLGKLGELLAAARARSISTHEGLLGGLAARRYWLLLTFTPLAIGVGLVAVPVAAFRAIARRDELEALPLLFAGMAVFQYLAFPQGADVHVFWPQTFAPYFALGLGMVATSGAALARRWARRFESRRPRLPDRMFRAVLALGFLVPVLMARDAATALVYAKKTGGRFNERGRFIQPDKDKVAALDRVRELVPEAAAVGLDANMQRSLWIPWVLQRRVVDAGVGQTGALEGAAAVLVTDGRFADARTLRESGRRSRTLVIGPFWIFDRAAPPAPAEAFTIARVEPAGLARYFVSSTHALRKIEPDPFATWEIRDHLDETPNPAPSVEPRTADQIRIAHNIAVHDGDHARADVLRALLLAGADGGLATTYDDGTKLLGVRFDRGASDVLTVYFESAAPVRKRFVVRSRVEARPAGSLVPADPLEWEVGLPPSLPPEMWRPGYLYASVTEILKRPGRERFVGSWVDPRTASSRGLTRWSNEVTLLVLP